MKQKPIFSEINEDNLELSEETKRDIQEARAEYKAGKFYTHKEVKRKLGLDKYI